MLSMAAVTSCENTEETFDQFLVSEVISNIGAPMAVASQAGTERVTFELALPADPRIVRGNVEWVQGGTPMVHEFEVIRTTSGLDTLEITLNNVEEGIKKFTFTLFDDPGNSSNSLEHTRPVYGTVYQAGLLPRRINGMEAFPKTGFDSTSIQWSIAIAEIMETTLMYKDLDGKEHQIIIPAEETITSVERYDKSVPFSFFTRYIPEPNALDTYLSDTLQVFFPKVALPLDKSLWRVESLANDVPVETGGGFFNLNHAWDGVPDNYAAALAADFGTTAERPYHFTLDLGLSEPAQLAEFSWAGFPLGPSVEVRAYQVWGIADIADAATTTPIEDDLSAWEAEMESKGWVKLFEGIRSQGDEGHTVAIDNETVVRFVRIATLDNHLSGNPDIAWGEIGLKGFL